MDKMQTVLPLTPGNPLRNTTGLARQIALPGEHAPLRFPSFPALERTAVMGFNQPASLTLPASTPVAVTLFRQACWPVWADQTTAWASVVDYSAEVYSPPTVAVPTSSVIIPMRPAISSHAVANRQATGTTVGIGGIGFTNPLIYPVLAADRGLPGAEFTYVPAGATFVIAAYSSTGETLAASMSIVVTYDIWSSPGEMTNSFVNISTPGGANVQGGMSPPIVSPAGRWVRPASISLRTATTASTITFPYAWNVTVVASTSSTYSYSVASGVPGVVTLTDQTAKVVHLPLVHPAEFANSALPWFASRVTASAILGTNVSQVLNKGGTILGGRLSPAVYNAWDATAATLSNLHPAEKAYLPLETGFYTYAPPSTDLVFFCDYTLNTTAGAAPAPLFILSNDSLYNKMFVTAGGVTEALACTVSWHLEFRTSSALFQIGLSAMTLESLHAAQLVLAESGFFFENEQHEGLLAKVIATAKKYAPSVVGTINPVAGRMLTSVLNKMTHSTTVKPKPGPSKPVTTTAEASGMTGKKGAGKRQGKKQKKAKVAKRNRRGK